MESILEDSTSKRSAGNLDDRSRNNQPKQRLPELLDPSSSRLQEHAGSKQGYEQPTLAKKAVIVDLDDTSSAASSLSPCHLLVRQASNPVSVADDENKIMGPDEINHCEKVSGWLQNCREMAKADPCLSKKEMHTSSDAVNSEQKSASSNRFFTAFKRTEKYSQASGGKRFLNVSDTDPYKFVPSQKSLRSAQRARKTRGKPRKTRASAAKKRAPISSGEFQNLRELYVEETARSRSDARELDIELFVTPGVMPEAVENSISKTSKLRKSSSRSGARQSKKQKTGLQLQAVQRESEELQQRISEAEEFELVVLKKSVPVQDAVPASRTSSTTALKDVSNLITAAQKDKVANDLVSPIQRLRSKVVNSHSTSTPRLIEEPSSNQSSSTSVPTIRPSPHSSVLRRGIASLPSISEKSKLTDSLATVPTTSTLAKEVPRVTGQELLASDDATLQPEVCSENFITDSEALVENNQFGDKNEAGSSEHLTTGSELLVANIPFASGNDTACAAEEHRCPEETPTEEIFDEPVPSLKELGCLFKKSKRKTFDLSANTQDLQSLGTVAVDTLDLMSNICNGLEDEVPRTWPLTSAAKKEAQKGFIAKPNCLQPQTNRLMSAKNSTKEGVAAEKEGGDHNGSSGANLSMELATPGTEFALASTESFTNLEKLPKNVPGAVHEASTCCPNCSMDVVITWDNGIVKVTLKGTSQKPALVDVGMCTERQETRVIICKEVTTQTDPIDMNHLCTESSSRKKHTSSAEQSPTDHGNSPLIKDVSAADHVPAMLSKASDGIANINFSLLADAPKCNMLSKACLRDAHMIGPDVAEVSLQKAIEMARPKSGRSGYSSRECRDIEVAMDFSDMGQSNSDCAVLCEETEEQMPIARRTSRIESLPPPLETIVEESEQTYGSQSASNKYMPNANNASAEEACHPDQEGSEVQGSLLSPPEVSLLLSQNESFTKRGCHANSSPTSHPTKEGPSLLETPRGEVDDDKHTSTLHSTQNAQAQKLLRPEFVNITDTQSTCISTCHELFPVAYGKKTKSFPEACGGDHPHNTTAESSSEGQVQNELGSSILTQLPAQLPPTDLQQEESPSDSGTPAEIAVPSSALQNQEAAVSPKIISDDHMSEELSPWSSGYCKQPTIFSSSMPSEPKHQDKNAPLGFMAQLPAPVKRFDSSQSTSVKKSFGNIPSKNDGVSAIVIPTGDSDSDSSVNLDPMTESEANDLLQRALPIEEDSPDEVALKFARRAVAPLKKFTRRQLSPRSQVTGGEGSASHDAGDSLSKRAVPPQAWQQPAPEGKDGLYSIAAL